MVVSLGQRVGSLVSSLAIAGSLLLGVGVVSASQQEVRNLVPVSSPAVSAVRNGGLEGIVSNLTPLGQDVDGQDGTITQTKKIYLPLISVSRPCEWPCIGWPFAEDTVVGTLMYFDVNRGGFGAYNAFVLPVPKNGSILAFDCSTVDGELEVIEGYGRGCIDGHDGYDYLLRDGTPIFAVGDGLFRLDSEPYAADVYLDKCFPVGDKCRKVIALYAHAVFDTGLHNKHVVKGQVIGHASHDGNGGAIPFPIPDGPLFYEVHFGLAMEDSRMPSGYRVIDPYWGNCSKFKLDSDGTSLLNPWGRILWDPAPGPIPPPWRP